MWCIALQNNSKIPINIKQNHKKQRQIVNHPTLVNHPQN